MVNAHVVRVSRNNAKIFRIGNSDGTLAFEDAVTFVPDTKAQGGHR